MLGVCASCLSVRFTTIPVNAEHLMRVSRTCRFARLATGTSKIMFRKCMHLVLAMSGGSYVAILISHAMFASPSRFALANFHVALAVAIKAWWVRVTVVDPAYRKNLKGYKRLPVHMVLVLTNRQIQRAGVALAPGWVLSAAQQCALEAALRVSPLTTVWLTSNSDVSVDSRVAVAWEQWRASLVEKAPELQGPQRLGMLIVRRHHFHPHSTVGAWLLAKGAGLAFNASDWALRGWPTYPAIHSDLVRLDVLEGSNGGVYLDFDTVALDEDLLRLQSGVALQVPIEKLRWPWHISSITTGGMPVERLFEAMNGAVIISRDQSATIARRIAIIGLESWESWNFTDQWGVIGPRAVTLAWLAGGLGSDAKLYDGATFGFVTCATYGRRNSAHGPGDECKDFSSSALPIDDPNASDRDWEQFLATRVAQHGLKSLLPAARSHTCSDARRRCIDALCSGQDHPRSVGGMKKIPLGRSIRTRVAESRCSATWRSVAPPPCLPVQPVSS